MNGGDGTVGTKRGCPYSSAELHERARNFTLFDPAVPDYFDLFAGFHDELPAFHSEQFGGFYVFTKYEDCRTILKDSETFSSRQIFIPKVEIVGAEGGLIPEEVDQPDHGKYRAALNAALGPRRVRPLYDDARRIADEYLAKIVQAGSADLVADFCVPFPVYTFLLMLGAPADDAPQLLYWKERMLGDGLGGDEIKRAEVQNEVLPAMVSHFEQMLAARRGSPDAPDDLLTALANATIDGRPWSQSELRRATMQYLMAGLDTVTSALSSMLYFLATHPEHRRDLDENRDLIPNAVEEMLRYCGLTGPARYVTRDTEVGGIQLRAGDLVHCILQATGRDPDEFPDADVVDFRRQTNRHLAFGAGRHRCQGSHLARMELAVALEAVLDHLPDLALAPGANPVPRWGYVFGFSELPIVVKSRS